MNAVNVIPLNAAHAVTHERRTKLSTLEMGCALPQPAFATMEEVHHAHELRLRVRAHFLRAAGGEPHVQPCSFQQRYEAARGPLIEWLSRLPAEYERLKARAAADAAANDRFKGAL